MRQFIRRTRSRIKRWRIKGTTVLAVTGSCGKTSATFFLSEILKRQDSCVSGIDKNDHNAVYRSLRDMEPGNQYYVQEVSGHVPGQLARALPLLRHHVGVVTTVGLDHYRAFRSHELVAKEKSTMVRLLPQSGTAVLNADDPRVAAMAGATKARVLLYGKAEAADVRATDIRSAWPGRLSFKVHYQGETASIETCLFGDLLLTSVLAAIAAALAAGVSLSACASALNGIEAYDNRMAVSRTSKGVWMIDDASKAPNWTLPLVIEQMAKAAAPRKTIVIGSMSDTKGSDSDKYRYVAKDALKAADRVIFVGHKAHYIKKMMGPENEGRLLVFEAIDDAARFLNEDVLEDELVMLKSGGKDHLERLKFAQDYELKCWLQRCDKSMRCNKCSESGLME